MCTTDIRKEETSNGKSRWHVRLVCEQILSTTGRGKTQEAKPVSLTRLMTEIGTVGVVQPEGRLASVSSSEARVDC